MANVQTKPAQPARAVRVLVADSSRIHTQLLSEALQRDPELDVVTWHADPRGLLAAALAGDVNVLAISSALDGHPARGLETLRELRAARPSIRAVVLLDSRKPEAILDAFSCRSPRSRQSGHRDRDVLQVHPQPASGTDLGRQRRRRARHRGAGFGSACGCPLPMGLNLLSKRECEVVQSLVQGTHQSRDCRTHGTQPAHREELPGFAFSTSSACPTGPSFCS